MNLPRPWRSIITVTTIITGMIDGFVLKSLIAVLTVGISAAVIGCFVVWRKMAYFGDSLAHSSILGVAFGILTNINLSVAVVASCMLFAALFLWLQHKKIFSPDALLGILAHATLATALVILSLANITGVDIHGFLFGDVLAVGDDELSWIIFGGVLALGLIFFFWNDLLLVTINEDLAQAEGKKTTAINLIFMLAMTLITAIALNVVGALLITAMLIIPAASARRLAASPEGMALFAVLLSIGGSFAGMMLAFTIDAPPGPTIVMVLALLFFAVIPLDYLRKIK